MATSATLLPYYGEFLHSPFPVELSMGKCSHGCRYCFSRANGYEGWRGYDAFVKTLKKILDGTKNDLCAQLIRQKFPVLISNRSDPFAQSNSRDALMVLKLLTKNEIPVTIQTKGGPGAEQAAAMLPPSYWYISISFSENERMRQMEPGAPDLDERYHLIETLRKHGHHVAIGINPLVRAWTPDPRGMLQRIKDAGAYGVVCEFLHLNKDQKEKLDAKSRELLGCEAEKASKRIEKDDDDYRDSIRAMCSEVGLDCSWGGQATYGRRTDVYDALYPSRFGTNQDLVNICIEQIPDNTVLSFEDYWEAIGPTFPAGMYQLDSIIYSMARNLWKEVHPPRYMTFRDLLKIIWSSPKHRMCPANWRCFSYVLSRDIDESGEKKQIVDEDGLPFMAFSKAGFSSYYVDAPEGM